MVAPINSIKHYVGLPIATITAANNQTNELIDAKVAPASAAPEDVHEGSIIKAVFIEMWIVNDAASGIEAQFTVALEKKPSDGPDMTFTNSQNLGAYPNKKNILYVTQGLLAPFLDGQSSVPLLRQWILIPKGKQRFGLGDQLVLNMAAVGQDIRRCGISTYKEYT